MLEELKSKAGAMMTKAVVQPLSVAHCVAGFLTSCCVMSLHLEGGAIRGA